MSGLYTKSPKAYRGAKGAYAKNPAALKALKKKHTAARKAGKSHRKHGVKKPRKLKHAHKAPKKKGSSRGQLLSVFIHRRGGK